VAKSKKRKPISTVPDADLAFEMATNPFKLTKKKKSGGVIRKKTGGHIVDSYDY
jgi:hypothetical protein